MELFKTSKKRGFFPALTELTNFHVKKKKETQISNDGKKISEVSEDELEISDMSTTSSSTDTGEPVSGSSCDDINKISRKQRTFAKMSVMRDKKKEKEKREKKEKNRISMEDFLNKHAEFCAWLEDEKRKCTKNMSSPKLKTYFKAFMKLWNKRKLPMKYYRGSTDSESPCPTYVARGFNFDEEEVFDVRKYCKPKSKRLSIENNNVLDSPFSTFGKTPPKLLPITSLQRLDTYAENDTQNGNENLQSPTETKEQQAVHESMKIIQSKVEDIFIEKTGNLNAYFVEIFNEYQVPVKQNKLESVSDQGDNTSNIEPYVVTSYPWVNNTPTTVRSSESDHSTHSDDFPVYAQPIKHGRKKVAVKPDISIPSHNSPPPIPPPPQFSDIYVESEPFSLYDGHYKSIDMDINLPPPPPPADHSVDDTLMNTTLPSPPVNQSGCHEFTNDTLPSPPGYAEIKCADSPVQGEWNPAAKGKVYSPRKFKLTKCTSNERIYAEIPPPVAPKPKRQMFFDSVYKSEENMYVEMNNVISHTEQNVTPILYSDYAVPADVINTDQINNHTEHKEKVNYELHFQQTDVPNQQIHIRRENHLNTFGTFQPMARPDFSVADATDQSKERKNDTPPVVSDSDSGNKHRSTSPVIRKNEPHVFRTSGKGCSDILGNPKDIALSNEELQFHSDSERCEDYAYPEIRKNINDDTVTLRNPYRVRDNRKICEERKTVLETSIDTDIADRNKTKMKRSKSAETVIW